MNAVEIEQAVSALAELSFDAAEFPFAFLEALGNKATTIKRLRRRIKPVRYWRRIGTNHIHIGVAEPCAVTATLAQLNQ